MGAAGGEDAFAPGNLSEEKPKAGSGAGIQPQIVLCKATNWELPRAKTHPGCWQMQPIVRLRIPARVSAVFVA